MNPNPLQVAAEQLLATPTRQALADSIAGASLPTVLEWTRSAPEALRDLLRSGTLDPQVVLPTLLAVSQSGTLAVFEGDPVGWFARQSGLRLREVGAFLRAARWLHVPSKLPLEPALAAKPPAERTVHARAVQSRLRELFRRHHSSLWIITICCQQTAYLAEEARGMAPGIIAAALEEAGPYPDDRQLTNLLQSQVQEANRACLVDRGNYGYLRFSRVRRGMSAIKGFCTRTEANQIETALHEYARANGVDPQLPPEKQAFWALKQICASDHTPTCEEGVQYRININLTGEEYAHLLAGKRAVVQSDLEEPIPWLRVLREHGGPAVDAITVVDGPAAGVRELPGARFFSPEQRRYMLSYQSRCAHPGCDVPARACEAHHIKPFAEGGLTVTDNLALVCHLHHARNDDTHTAPGRFHYAKDPQGIPYVQYHPERPGDPPPPPRYNLANRDRSPAARARKQQTVRIRSARRRAGSGRSAPPASQPEPP